jgi:hypothetical protein
LKTDPTLERKLLAQGIGGRDETLLLDYTASHHRREDFSRFVLMAFSSSRNVYLLLLVLFLP